MAAACRYGFPPSRLLGALKFGKSVRAALDVAASVGELALLSPRRDDSSAAIVVSMNRSQDNPRDYRRTLLLVLAIGLLLACVIVSLRFEQSGTARLVAAATGRIGLVLGALWLAWPSLRRPAQWLPPGVAVLGVVTLVVLAAQPRLFIVAIPLFCGLLALATFIRAIKG